MEDLQSDFSFADLPRCSDIVTSSPGHDTGAGAFEEDPEVVVRMSVTNADAVPWQRARKTFSPQTPHAETQEKGTDKGKWKRINGSLE